MAHQLDQQVLVGMMGWMKNCKMLYMLYCVWPRFDNAGFSSHRGFSSSHRLEEDDILLPEKRRPSFFWKKKMFFFWKKNFFFLLKQKGSAKFNKVRRGSTCVQVRTEPMYHPEHHKKVRLH
jgi:hypothetical protein